MVAEIIVAVPEPVQIVAAEDSGKTAVRAFEHISRAVVFED